MYYTASVIITPVGGSPVHWLREDSEKNCALIWLNTKIVLRWTVSKTSKLVKCWLCLFKDSELTAREGFRRAESVIISDNWEKKVKE